MEDVCSGAEFLLCLLFQQREAIIAMLTAVIHISDINFLHDVDTDGVYIENEEILEIGLFHRISRIFRSSPSLVVWGA